VLLAISACPIGVFLMLRRMSLAGDAMAHAILPGAAAGFVLFGLDLLPMTFGGLLAGLMVAIAAGAVSRLTLQREDASLAAFYLISLALGVLLVSLRGSSVDLMHVLFGTVLALNNQVLALIGGIAGITLATLAVIWRALVAECLDPLFLRSVSRAGPVVHFIFLILVVLNLVGGFAALGTLLSVGLMILPAAAARFWMVRAMPMCALAVGIGSLSSIVGLLLSYHLGVASGPAIILTAGVFYLASMVGGRRGLISARVKTHRHRAA
jgi:zinc/manganese transport system permease protein